MSVCICLSHPVAVSVLIIWSGLCSCTDKYLYSSFLISVCMFIGFTDLLISSATVISREGGAIWSNTFATVFNVCRVLYPCCVGVSGMFTVMQEKMLFSSVFAINVMRDMGLYDVPLSTSLLGFGVGTMLPNFHMCDIMLVFSTCS